MSKIGAPSINSYLKIRSKTHMNEEWTSILDSNDWSSHINHCSVNTTPVAHSLREWFEDEFCMNKILRTTPETPDLETHAVSIFTCQNKIFLVVSIPIPTEATADQDCEATLHYYGGEHIQKVIDFFTIEDNLSKLFSIKPF